MASKQRVAASINNAEVVVRWRTVCVALVGSLKKWTETHLDDTGSF